MESLEIESSRGECAFNVVDDTGLNRILIVLLIGFHKFPDLLRIMLRQSTELGSEANAVFLRHFRMDYRFLSAVEEARAFNQFASFIFRFQNRRRRLDLNAHFLEGRIILARMIFLGQHKCSLRMEMFIQDY